jgi:hypothetical protein
MFKGKIVVFSLIAAALLCWQMMPATTANSGIVDPCSSTAIALPGCFVICPQGDGAQLDAIGSTILVTAKDNTGAPIPGIPAADYWLVGCTDVLELCGGSGAINADSASNASGVTTITNALAAGGCELGGVSVVLQGIIIASPLNCNDPLCLPITTVSPDVAPTGAPDLVVDIIDLGDFAIGYTSPPKPYVPCLDFNCDGDVDIIDFSIFAQHYLHSC